MKLITLVSLRMTCSLRSLRSEFAFLSSLSICFVIATVCGGWQAVWLCCHDNSKLCASMCGIHCLIALISVHFQSLGTLSCMLIFLNFSDVSRMFSFLLLYYYLCILDVMIRLPLVLVWAWYIYVLLTDCIQLYCLQCICFDIIWANKMMMMMNLNKQLTTRERSFMQIKWTSGQLKIMSSSPEYIPERSGQ